MQSMLNYLAQSASDGTATPEFNPSAYQTDEGLSGIVIIILSLVAILYIVTFLAALTHLLKNPSVPNRRAWMLLVALPFVGGFYLAGPRTTFNSSVAARKAAVPPQQIATHEPTVVAPTSQPNDHQR